MVVIIKSLFEPPVKRKQQEESNVQQEPNDQLLDISGVWEGDYGRNGIEIVEIEYIQNFFVANKLYV